MLLMELTGVKRFHKYTEYQLYKILRRLGIEIVDGGTYGKILTSSKWDYVVKMFKDDPYYLSFVKFVKQHPNKHYPKFGRAPLEMHMFHTRDERDGDKMWMLKIEKLEPLDKKTQDFIVRNIDFAGTVAYWLETEDKRPQSKEQLDYFNKDAGPRLYFDGERKNETIREWAKAHEWLISLAEAWNDIFENDDVAGSPDLHGRNFMKRKDDTIVIIDPLWEGSNPYKEYDAWYKSMTDSDDGGYYDVSTKSGPTYKRHKAEKKKPVPQDVHDDIPF